MGYNFCGGIDALMNLAPDCELQKGYEDLGWIIKRGDINFSASNTNDDFLIDTLKVISDGTKFFYLGQLKEAFSGTTVSMNQGTYRNTFTNTVSFKIFNNGDKITKMINSLANGEYVMVLEQKHKDEADGTINRTYRVFGWEQGLVASAIDNDNYDDDLADGWSITMEETNASSASYYLAADQVMEAVFPKPF